METNHLIIKSYYTARRPITYSHTYTYTHTHKHTHTYIHTHTHTHWYKRRVNHEAYSKAKWVIKRTIVMLVKLHV